MKLTTLAEKTFSEIEQGEADLELTGAAGLDIAVGGQVTFLANPKYTPQIKETKASAIFLNENIALERTDIAILRPSVPNPCRLALSQKKSFPLKSLIS